MTAGADAILSASQPTATLGIGETAVDLARLSIEGDILFAAADEQRGMAITQALMAALPEAAVLFCPSSDALPGDDAPASPANVGRRVSTLLRIRQLLAEPERPRIVCITTGEALGRLYSAPAAFDTVLPRVVVGEVVDLGELFKQLEEIGYIPDERVDEPGEIGLRGQVLDVYPADADAPLRVEASEGRVAAIRIYDPADQRTTSECDRRELGRVAEPPLGETAVTLLDHLPNASVIIPPAADDRRKRFIALAQDAARRRPKRAVRDVATDPLWRKALSGRMVTELQPASEPPPRFVEAKRPLQAYAEAATAAAEAGLKIALLGSDRDLRFISRRVASAMKRSVDHVGSWAEIASAEPGSMLALNMPIERGFNREGVLVVAAADLLGSRAERGDALTATADTTLFSFGQIRIGDVVVHEDHGISIVAGPERMPEVDGADSGDAIALTFADGGIRLVPVAKADRIWRYGAEADAVTLDKLDGGSWEKRRGAIDAAIAESARGLTKLAAERAKRTAPKLEPAADAYERFAAGFPFSETIDQARAIEAVRDDLASGRPMDRLVVGDVGYGKTEVALRAAAIAALAGRQVAVAAPTTVLARQHIESFTERFEGTGIVVAGLFRLSTAAEKKQVKVGLADGSIGVVVGTGAVAAKGVAYKDLALVIIDEEQRFGAADKARMRELGAGHVLTLSATPIPRTLQTALVGLQQLSVIATPPARRQPIRTSVGPFVPETVRTALLREKSRGGQSFVVVPRIEDMAALAAQLEKIVPELELVQAHGKMPALEIDDAMVRFGRGDGDVLLATNIIEAGLDVPRANTMVIWRADRFGLSQLHQLRGRVGRGSRRGQVLLLTDPSAEIAPRTLKRLRTLEAFDRLGAGFAISAQDLDMRGAGDLLGEAQAGHMKLIGIDLYQHLLEASIRASRGEGTERWSPELNLGAVGRFPESWLPDEELRVTLYCRLARIEDGEGLQVFADELEDRFGTMPPEAETLLRIARIRVAARAARISRIDAGPAAVALTPRNDFDRDAESVGIEKKKGRLLLPERIEDPAARIARVEKLVEVLSGQN
ncbi:TRCF domain-containing protein [Sphingomonas nostoxanthinifaciens]|uniref:TRCF domain-containing protein n=1 Tax=Sphingomonas nostoxanthinifaciens TaxID=2872652 RepID=UPI001CC1FBD8|nr:TRCF domain-containing protein [Sphingomonas nostoxanthinifaciens]UAK25666.1 DEAD/DEAH box helicase [Sphingomonas nostoxanthinifaciens]